MIEFKADCGHAVRARDEDAGSVVRCSYCGRDATVPVSADHTLDYLFAEVQQTVEEPSGRRRRRGRKTATADRPGTPRRPFNPFPIIVRLCYGAGLIIVAVVVYSKFIAPMFDAEKRAARLSGVRPTARAAAKRIEDPPGGATPKPRGLGLVRDTPLMGLYVASTPPGALVWCLNESKAPLSGRIVSVPGCMNLRAPCELNPIPDGTYVVEVAFATSDPALSKPDAEQRARYVEFRRKVENAPRDQRQQLVDDYFIPDEASSVFVDESDDQVFFVRQYRGISAKAGRSKGVRSLFLPKLFESGQKGFRIEPLIKGFIPDAANYVFDENHVRDELEFYSVTEKDRVFMLRMLAGVGAVPHVCDDGRTLIFKIDLYDGKCTTAKVRGAP